MRQPLIPTGKIKITFTSDVGVNHQSSPTLCSGIQISFSIDNSYPSSTLANGYISGNSIVNGNVGIGVLNPSYKLEVNGTAKFLENVQCFSTISFHDNARFNVTNATIPNLRTSSFSMPQYGIGSPGSGSSAEFWLAGNYGIRMFTAGNVIPRLSILNNGNVGIGTITPQSKLDVNGEIRSTLNGEASNLRMICGGYASMFRNDGVNTYLLLTNNNDINGSWNSLRPLRINNPTGDVSFADDKVSIAHNTGNITTSGDVTLFDGGKIGIGLTDAFQYDNKTMGHYSLGWFPDSQNSAGTTLWVSAYGGMKFFTAGAPRLTISTSGYLGIGTTTPDELLTVNGTIHAKEVKVDLTGSLADYVFAPDYELMPLSHVESFVKTNNHLPDMPSANDVQKNGLNMGEMQNKLLQKVEELTLYVIELQKQVDELKSGKK